MAAYAALVSLAQTIDHILYRHTYSFSRHQKDQITSIHKHLIFLQAFLQDFPGRSNSSLEGRIRDISNEAENTIEYLMYENDETRVKAPLEQLIVAIDSIAQEAMGIKNSVTIKDLRQCHDDSPAASSSSRLNSAAAHQKDVMVGLDDDLLAIKERLFGESSKLQVIPIVGMGGIGKTTLALNVYDDLLTIYHFHIRSWMTISQEYSNEQEILSSLLVSINPERSGQSHGSVEENVYRSLKGKRYLIVLDDIWSTEVWDDVRRIFPDDHNGSRIILTTRLTDVAAYADSSCHLHQIRLMGIDQSWDLLRQKVFKQELCPPELVTIGKEIARSCKGLPLAIVVVAGVLSTVSKTPTSWEEIAKSVKSAIAVKDEQFENIFSLSYTHLPHHLRVCFLYMGAFPEDHKINVSKLIKLWVAEGFPKPSEFKNLEDMAEEYFEDLVKRFLVLVSEKKCSGKIKSCRLHDVIRELCIRKAEQEKLLLHVMDSSNVLKESIKNQRRLSIKQSYLRNCVEEKYGSTSTIRTLICFVRDENSNMYPEYFRFLRVWAFEYGYVSNQRNQYHGIPAQLFELIHLRYISFMLTDLNFSIPAVISVLQNLQTLIINSKWNYSHKVSLPLEIWRMPQLRHLVCYRFDGLPNPEKGAITCGLENLQTLSEVRNLECSKSMMRMIPNIKKLGIYYYRNEEYQLENLVQLRQLEKMKLTVFGSVVRMKNIANPVFPRTLKKLSLIGEDLPWEKDMMKIVGSLPNLQVLKLRNSSQNWRQWETSEGEFPQLKYLLIRLCGLEEWISESSHFPSLNCLLLHSCHSLREIPDCIGDIPTLELIHVDHCPEYVEEWAKRIKEEQQSNGNDALQLRCLNCYR